MTETHGFEMTSTIRTLHDGYRGLALLMELNWDRILFPTALGLALMLGTYLATIS